MNLEQLRNELRNGSGKQLSRSRATALIASLGILDFLIISLYQVGILKQVPDLPYKFADSNQVIASTISYKHGIPDGPVGIISNALVFLLSFACGTRKTGRSPLFDIIVGVIVLLQAYGAVLYIVAMITRVHKLCIYCIFAALLHFTMLPFVIPELLFSFKIRGQRSFFSVNLY